MRTFVIILLYLSSSGWGFFDESIPDLENKKPPEETFIKSVNYTPMDHQIHHGIHIANWRWDEIGLFFAFTAFIIVTGLAKVAFHHASFLSERIPESCLMIIMGITVGAIVYFSDVPIPVNSEDRILAQKDVHQFAIPTFTPRLFFLILLPPVILESAYSLYDKAFADNLYTILLYAVVGTIFNTFTIGPTLFLLSELGLMGPMEINPGPFSYTLSMSDCLVFSALISAVDPVAVLAIFQEVGVNKDLYYLVFGESLLNDAVTVVLYTTMVTFSNMDHVPPGQYGLAILAFFSVSLGGLLVGIIFGLISALVTRTTGHVRVVEPLAVLGLAYFSYLTAELFHFSGIISIIGCGICQAHYALKNISRKSYVTVKYFTKMVSSTCDAVIFLFLGMVLVSDRHQWHTGFVLWSVVLCLVCRFLGVFLLSSLANLWRAKHIAMQEQLIMAYGGLRGAVAFSLVEMLQADTIKPRQIFVTTTLIIILFTVFIQGASIKPLVKLLQITLSKSTKKTLNEEIHEQVINNVMSSIEDISGIKGDFYFRKKIDVIDNFFRKIFLKKSANDLKRLYEKLCLTDHYAHLYGPAAVLVGSGKEELGDLANKIEPTESDMQTVNLRRPMTPPPPRSPTTAIKYPKDEAEQLRTAFKNSPYQKFQKRHSFRLVDDGCQDLDEQLERRRSNSKRIISLAAQARRRSSNPSDSDGEHFVETRKRIESDLGNEYPEQLEGIKAILETTSRRISKRQSQLSMMGDSVDGVMVTAPLNTPGQNSPTPDTPPDRPTRYDFSPEFSRHKIASPLMKRSSLLRGIQEAEDEVFLPEKHKSSESESEL